MSRRHPTPLAVLLAALALAPPAFAQPPDEAAQSAARTLGLAALTLYDQGDYPRALEKFEQAYLVYKAPTLGLGAARCLVKLGKLVAASERYSEVARTELDPSATIAFRQAKEDSLAAATNPLAPPLKGIEGDVSVIRLRPVGG